MEDTVRTRVLNSARLHWKEIVAYFVAGVGVAAGTLIAFGEFRAKNSADHDVLVSVSQKLDKLDLRMQGFEMQQEKMQQSLDDTNKRQDRTERFLDDAAEEAGKWPQPRKHH